MDEKEAAILRVITGLWETYEWVPVSEIVRRVPWNALKVKAKIREMERKKLVLWNPRLMGEPSVKVTERGMDAIALWDLLKSGVVEKIGGVVGEGKEAKIILALKGEERYAIKLHRYYSAEFKHIKKSLAYAMLRWWRFELRRLWRPLDVARAKAQVEYYALKKLYPDVAVPRPITINRHAVVMEFIGDDIPAPLLSEVRDVTQEMMDEVVENYMKALERGIVHGDMSEYNVMVWDRCYLIDWPQAVPRDFEGAEKLIERDMKNIRRFFEKKLS